MREASSNGQCRPRGAVAPQCRPCLARGETEAAGLSVGPWL